jgi:hypothetical protein
MQGMKLLVLFPSPQLLCNLFSLPYMKADLEHIPVCSDVGLSFSSSPALLARMCWLHILAQVLALFHGGMAPYIVRKVFPQKFLKVLGYYFSLVHHSICIRLALGEDSSTLLVVF